MLINLAKMAKIHKFGLANSLLDSPMATWLALTGTLSYDDGTVRLGVSQDGDTDYNSFYCMLAFSRPNSNTTTHVC